MNHVTPTSNSREDSININEIVMKFIGIFITWYENQP